MMFRFSILGMPIIVEGWFWLTCVLLGGGLTANEPRDWAFVAVWTSVVFVSIIVHELGHAIAARRFGVQPAIKLHGLGGATYLPGARFSRKESILVSAAGPAAGLALGFVILILSRALELNSEFVRAAVVFGLYVNFFWTFINLLPIQPLDGGQILREVLGPRQIQVTRWIGFGLALVLCLWSLSIGRVFLALMMGMLAYYNIRQEPIEGGVVKG